MLARKALIDSTRLRHCSWVSKNVDITPSAGASSFDHSESVRYVHRQQRVHFSSGKSAPPQKSLSAKSDSATSSGNDYLSLFQPTSATSITPFSPGNVLKVYPLPRYVLKEDVVRHVEGSNVQPENLKFIYGSSFRPDYVQITVDSSSTQKQVTKCLQERGRLGFRLLRLEMSQPMPWTIVDAALKDSPRGRTLLMYNVSLNTDFEDVERFFAGYSYDSSYVRFIRV
ncbi:hypothetical protein KP509_39G003200 [Ceratopteris richardii]|nr:hypothetical protein KP509_39G003200 [Ceratopteris richardii]